MIFTKTQERTKQLQHNRSIKEIKRAFDDLKEAKPESWDPKKEVTYKADFLNEDVLNQKQWDGTDGSELEEKKKPCKSGMYTTSQACGKECEGGKCENGAKVLSNKSRIPTADVDTEKLQRTWGFLSVMILKHATRSLVHICRSFWYTWFFTVHA